ncbi:MAG: hypothetical protein ACTSYS_10280 [Promethearchaeota archaeon]
MQLNTHVLIQQDDARELLVVSRVQKRRSRRLTFASKIGFIYLAFSMIRNLNGRQLAW